MNDRLPAIVDLKGLPLISDNFRHRFAYRHIIDHTVVCAGFIRDEYMRYPWADPDLFSVIYNCYKPPPPVEAQTEHPTIREELRIRGEDPVVGAVARFDYRKGIQDLIAAAPAILATHPQTTFVVIGDGREKERLIRQIADAGLQNRVILPGFRRDLDAVFPVFDVFVLPSHSEGFPYVTQIAMHHRKAIVATRVGGIADAITDGVNGLLVEPQSPGQLARAINLLLDRPDLRLRLGVEAAATLREKFPYAGMIDQFEALLRRVVDGRTNRGGRGGAEA